MCRDLPVDECLADSHGRSRRAEVLLQGVRQGFLSEVSHLIASVSELLILFGPFFRAKLDKHASVHSDARNHECNVCGKRFKSKEANRVHQRVHTEERPYACHICSRAFRYNCGLKAHLERGHDPGELNQPKLKANVNSSDSTIGWF